MLNLRAVATAGALTVLPQLVLAAEAARCVDVSTPKAAVEKMHGKWIGSRPSSGNSCAASTR